MHFPNQVFFFFFKKKKMSLFSLIFFLFSFLFFPFTISDERLKAKTNMRVSPCKFLHLIPEPSVTRWHFVRCFPFPRRHLVQSTDHHEAKNTRTGDNPIREGLNTYCQKERERKREREGVCERGIERGIYIYIYIYI